VIGPGNAGSDGSGSGDGVGSGSGGGSEGSVGSGNCGFRGSGLIPQADSRTDASSIAPLRESCGENWVADNRVENFRSILRRIISLIRSGLPSLTALPGMHWQPKATSSRSNLRRPGRVTVRSHAQLEILILRYDRQRIPHLNYKIIELSQTYNQVNALGKNA
jgi:hypothetical protein